MSSTKIGSSTFYVAQSEPTRSNSMGFLSAESTATVSSSSSNSLTSNTSLTVQN